MQNEMMQNPELTELKQEFDRLVNNRVVLMQFYNKMMLERVDELCKLQKHYVEIGFYDDMQLIATPLTIVHTAIDDAIDSEQRFTDLYEDRIDTGYPDVVEPAEVLIQIDTDLAIARRLIDRICMDIEKINGERS